MRLIITLLLVLSALTTQAVIETYEFETAEQRERYNQFIEELRCPKCQNQNLAGSDSPIAADLRQQLHRLIRAGHNDADIQQYMLERYGDFILYRPRFTVNTALLWLFPVLMLGIGGGIWWFQLQANRRRQDDRNGLLSAEEQEKLNQLLRSDRDD